MFELKNEHAFNRLLNEGNFNKELPKSIILITPPSLFLMDERVFVNLGILKIGAVLENFGVGVEHLDLSGISNYIDALKNHLIQSDAKFLGITVTTPQLPSVVKIIKTVREIKPGIKIILGGPHITLTYSAVKLEKKNGNEGRAYNSLNKLLGLADTLITGDGEKAIFLALNISAPRIIDADDPLTGLFLTDQIYELTPYPARHLVEMSTYKYEIEGYKSTSLIAQLGCPFSCGFCGGRNSRSLRVIRTRSVDSILNEIKMMYEVYGYTGFMFYDDELNVSKNMTELMRGIIELQENLGVDFRLRGFIKSQLFTQEQANLMYSAGFRWLLSGFESGSPKILSNINKKATLDDNNRAIGYAKKAGLKVKALMSVGHPGESEETILKTKKWLLEVQPDDFDCTIITTYPGTPYYDEAVRNNSNENIWTYTHKKSGDRLHSFEIDYFETSDYYKGDPNDGYKAYVFSDFLSSKKIVKMRNWVEKYVREKLKIPFPKSRVALRFEHSVGQGFNNILPKHILHKSEYINNDFLRINNG